MKGFRVWSNYWKKYATEAELHMDGSADAVFEDDGGVPHHENTDIVVEFKTGLEDKNGKEIYEWDIVQRGENQMAIVKWSQSNARFNAINVESCRLMSFDNWTATHEMAILGNIRENLELLEEEG